MKNRLYILLIITVLVAGLLAGCANPASSQPSASSSASGTPIPTTPPDTESVSAPLAEADENQVTVDGWTYYLNETDAATVDYGEDPPLHRKSEDGASDEKLGLRGFAFDVIGEYLYLDSNYADLNENGTQTWYTTRMKLDGSDPRKLEYGSMSVRLIPAGEQKFYFTTIGDCAVYASDFACEDVTPIIFVLPDQSDLDNKLDADREMQLDINEVVNGWISFDVIFITKEGIQMYKGTYKIKEDGTGVEKVRGTYYDYESLESELD